MEQLDMVLGVCYAKQIIIMTTWKEEEKTQYLERKKKHIMKIIKEMQSEPHKQQPLQANQKVLHNSF